MSEMIYAVVSVFDNLEIVPHFLRHYTRLGVNKIVLSVRGKSPEIAESVAKIAVDYPAVVHFTPAQYFDCMERFRVENELLRRESMQDDDYVLHLDLDEFHEYPAPLIDIVRQMNKTNEWAVRGWMVDRVAADGVLHPIRAAPCVSEQFPLVADITKSIVVAPNQKIMLCRGRVHLNSGKHDTFNAYYDRVPLGFTQQYRVYHFKWIDGVIERLEQRITEPGTADGYKNECRSFIKHYRRHGRVDLAQPQLNARYFGSFVYHDTSPLSTYWWTDVDNFGDWIGPALLDIAGVRYVHASPSCSQKLLTVGSVATKAQPGDTVWGSGILDTKAKMQPAAKYLAVRGPYTRARVIASGGDCPELYGDPALLLPRYHKAKAAAHKLGLVLHHDSKYLNTAHDSTDCVLIDTRDRNVTRVVDRITSCEAILSSSLHGLIVAHAYGIPAAWIKIDGDVMYGDDIKFHDFYASLGVEVSSPPVLNIRHLTLELRALTRNVSVDIDLDRLRTACPFRLP